MLTTRRHSRDQEIDDVFMSNESMVRLQQCCNKSGEWETDTAMVNGKPITEQEGAGGGKRIQNMDFILAALRRIETETSKVTHDALSQQKKIDFEGFKMEERLSSYSVRHTGMQMHSLNGEKQLAEPSHKGQHENKERVSQQLHKYENEGEKYCGTAELVAEESKEAERQKKAQYNHSLQQESQLAEKESRIEQLQQRLAEAHNELQELTIKQEHEMRALMERLLEVFVSFSSSVLRAESLSACSAFGGICLQGARTVLLCPPENKKGAFAVF